MGKVVIEEGSIKAECDMCKTMKDAPNKYATYHYTDRPATFVCDDCKAPIVEKVEAI